MLIHMGQIRTLSENVTLKAAETCLNSKFVLQREQMPAQVRVFSDRLQLMCLAIIQT